MVNIKFLVHKALSLQLSDRLDFSQWSKAWSKRHVAHEMMLASADASGRILIWNVKSGEVKTQLSEGMNIMIFKR